VKNVAENTQLTIVMTIITIWALLDDDIRLAAAPKSGDIAFEVIISIAFFLFSAEILASCYYKSGYLNLPKWSKLIDRSLSWSEWLENATNFGSFYFWLDVLATFSLVVEVCALLCMFSQKQTLLKISDAVDGTRRYFWRSK
jgi:hypothetical protein